MIPPVPAPAPAPPPALVRCAERLSALDHYLGFATTMPTGAGWTDLCSPNAATEVDRWLDAALAADGGVRAADEVGASIGGVIAEAVTAPVVGCWELEGLGIDLRHASLAVRRHPDGWVEATALTATRLLVAGAAHRDAAGPGSEAVTAADLIDRVAAGLHDTLGPLLDVVRARTPFGRRGLWGGVSDTVMSRALWVRRAAGGDRQAVEATWDRVSALLDALDRRLPHTLARPRPYLVDATLGSTLMPVRAVCCLYYKALHDDAEYCSTCPLIDDSDRALRLSSWLDEELSAPA